MRPANILKVLLILAGALAGGFAVEVYNFPDLVQDLPDNTLPFTNGRPAFRVWGVETNREALDLWNIPPNTELGRAVGDLRLRQIMREPGSTFLWDYFRWDLRKRQLYTELMMAPTVKAPVDKGGPGLAFTLDNLETQMRLYGNQTLNLKWGTAGYLKYLDPTAASLYQYKYLVPSFIATNAKPPVRPFPNDNMPFEYQRLISDGFSADQNLVITLQGTIARKIDVQVEHDTRSRQNTYEVKYRGDPDEVIQSVRLGNVSVNLGGKSQFLTGGGGAKEAFGLEMKAGKKNLQAAAAVAFTRGVSTREDFNIGEAIQKKDIQYAANRFYQLPDQGIKDAVFMIAVYGDATNQADVAMQFYDLNRSLTKVFFQRVDGSRWRIDNTRGVFDCRGIKPGTPFYSILYYSYSNALPATVTNWMGPMSNNIVTPFTFSSNVPLFQNFALIDYPVTTPGDIAHSLELRNHYEVDTGFDISTFRMNIASLSGDLVDDQPWVGTYSHTFTYYGQAEVFPDLGYFRFVSPRALTNRPAWYAGLYDVLTPAEANSQLRFTLSYRAPAQNYIALSHPNILPNSVVVTRNGRILADTEYQVNLYSGRITFSPQTPLLLGDKIEVFYEYQPFGSSLQRVLLGGRVDYQIREGSYIGGGVSFSAGQTSLSAPRVGNETTSQVVADVDTQLDLVSLLSRKRENDWVVNVSGEYALSLYDRNVRGVSLFFNMEGDETEYSFYAPKNFQNYYFAANPRLDYLQDRRLGESRFVDFNIYNLSGSRTAVPFTTVDEAVMRSNAVEGIVNHRQDVNFRPFAVRPGPYQVYGEGQLDRSQFPEQSALVLDYDFSKVRSNGGTNLGYVSFVAPTTYFGGVGNRGIDFTKFKRMEIVYKLVPAVEMDGTLANPSNVVGFSIDVGTPSEDLDLRGSGDVLREYSAQDPTGFPFRYARGSTVVNTRLGGGWRGWRDPSTVDEGNGRLDTADFNNNGILNTEETMLTFPGAFAASGAGNSQILLWNSQKSLDASEVVTTNSSGAIYTALSTNGAGSDPLQREPYWKVSIPLKNLLGTNNLANARFFRLNVLEMSNTQARGRLVIDSIQFRGSSWNAQRVDGYVLPATPQWSVYVVNSLQDDFYRRNHYVKAFRNVYEDLNGSLNSTEFDRLSESALALDYNLTGIPSDGTTNNVDGKKAWVETYLPSGAVDLSAYDEMRFFTFVKSKSTDGEEKLIYRFGKDELNYFEVGIPLKSMGPSSAATGDNTWAEFTVQFRAKTAAEQTNFLAQKGNNLFSVLRRTSKVQARGNRNLDLPVALAADAYTVTRKGSPTLFQVGYTALGVENPSSTTRQGSLWVDDIYMGNDRLQFGQSYRFGIQANKKTPVTIRETEILSEVGASLSFQHQGLHFSSLDLVGNVNQRENLSFNAGIKILKTLKISMEMLRAYNTTEWDDTLMPKESQGTGDTAVDRLTLDVRWPNPLSRYIPDFSTSTSRSLNRGIRLIPVDSTGSNVSLDPESALLRVENQENVVRSYNVTESKNWQITPRVAINQSYRIGADISRTLLLATNLVRSAVTVFDPKGYNWYPVDAFLGTSQSRLRAPIYQVFPDPYQSLLSRRDLLVQVDYQFRRSQEASFEAVLGDFRLNASVSWGESTFVHLTNTTGDLDALRRMYEPQSYGSNALENLGLEWGSLWSDPRIKDLSQDTGRDRNYNLQFNLASPLLKGPVPILGGLSGGVSWGHSESDFRSAPRSFVAGDILDARLAGVSVVSQATFSQAAQDVAAYFTNLVPTRDLRDDFSLRLSLPLNFGEKSPIVSIPLNFTRRVTLSENDALMVNTGSDPLWNRISSSFPGFMGSVTADDPQGNSLNRASPLLFGSAPWFDFTAIQDMVFWVRGFFDNPATIARDRLLAQGEGRFLRAQQLDQAVPYQDRPNSTTGSLRPLWFSAHRDYSLGAQLYDRWEMTLSPRRYAALDYFLPESFRFAGSLTSGKNGAAIQQTLDREFSMEKRFDKLSRLISGLFKPGQGFSRSIDFDGAYSYKEQWDYNAKTVRRSDTIRAGSTLRLFRDLTIGLVYDLGIEKQVQNLRWSMDDTRGGTTYNPYMGIGSNAGVLVTNSGLVESLNLGQNENYLQALSGGVLPLESVDLVKYRHSFAVNLRWSEPKALVIRLFKKEFRLPPNTSQQIGINMNWYSYEVPGIDVEQFKQGHFDPHWQPNAQAVKNLSNFMDPNRNEFTTWSAKTGYSSTLNFTQNFSLTWGFNLALIQRLQVASYPAYLGIDYATIPDKSEWIPQYMRQVDYIQLGVELNLGGNLRF